MKWFRNPTTQDHLTTDNTMEAYAKGCKPMVMNMLNPRHTEVTLRQFCRNYTIKLHTRSNGNGRVKTADNWTFQTNPYITARPQIHCVGDDCKRSDLNVYYQYGKMNVNPPELIQYIPVILIATLALIILIIFLVKRHRANKKYQESMLSRMDDLREREYIETL